MAAIHDVTVEVEQVAPDAADTDLAIRAIRLHAIRHSMAGKHCLECGWPAPCVTRRWGVGLLKAIGWGDAVIEALDEHGGSWAL